MDQMNFQQDEAKSEQQDQLEALAASGQEQLLEELLQMQNGNNEFEDNLVAQLGQHGGNLQDQIDPDLFQKLQEFLNSNNKEQLLQSVSAEEFEQLFMIARLLKKSQSTQNEEQADENAEVPEDENDE